MVAGIFIGLFHNLEKALTINQIKYVSNFSEMQSLFVGRIAFQLWNAAEWVIEYGEVTGKTYLTWVMDEEGVRIEVQRGAYKIRTDTVHMKVIHHDRVVFDGYVDYNGYEKSAYLFAPGQWVKYVKAIARKNIQREKEEAQKRRAETIRTLTTG